MSKTPSQRKFRAEIEGLLPVNRRIPQGGVRNNSFGWGSFQHGLADVQTGN
jgi:hypothetical protein